MLICRRRDDLGGRKIEPWPPVYEAIAECCWVPPGHPPTEGAKGLRVVFVERQRNQTIVVCPE
jgi:hypothetical protein